MKTLTLGFLAVAILATMTAEIGCSSTSSGTTPVGVPISVNLMATATSINAGGSTTITASVTNDPTNAGVTWTQSGPAGGALTSVTTTSVTYTAPTNVTGNQVVSITATSNADTTDTASIQITIVGAAAPTITLAANPTSIAPGGSSNITATVTGDPTNAGVTWTQSGPAGGALTNVTTTSVTYTAPTNVTGTQMVTVTATSKVDTSDAASIQIPIAEPSITLSASPAIIDAGTGTGTQSAITAVVTGESSASVTWTQPTLGTLTNETATTATYNAPSSVTSQQVVTITATSTVGNLVGTTTVTVYPAGTPLNTAELVVNGGPVPPYPNGVFTTVTICQPGSTTSCTTVDGVLLDTGSFGLRILQSELNGLTLSPITISGQTLNDCVSFVDGSFLWGEVALANVQIGNETASSIPVQLVADPPDGEGDIPSPTNGFPTDGCNQGGTDDDSQLALGANGILGVGYEPTDCEVAGVNYCDGSNGSVAPGVYFLCSGPPNCTTGTVDIPDNQQVTNPVVAFPVDNNGTMITFPAVAAGQGTATGTITFGIGTESNNAVPGTATVYQLDGNDNFATTFSGEYLPQSFIDSGSNAYFIPDDNGVITICSDGNGFFCPTSADNLSAQNSGTSGILGPVTDFTIGNADTLLGNTSDTAFSQLGGPNDGTGTACTNGGNGYTGDCSFDWGLPFFFGNTVFTSIDTKTVTGQPTTPWWAY